MARHNDPNAGKGRVAVNIVFFAVFNTAAKTAELNPPAGLAI
jgi:hypothetical protein